MKPRVVVVALGLLLSRGSAVHLGPFPDQRACFCPFRNPEVAAGRRNNVLQRVPRHGQPGALHKNWHCVEPNLRGHSAAQRRGVLLRGDLGPQPKGEPLLTGGKSIHTVTSRKKLEPDARFKPSPLP